MTDSRTLVGARLATDPELAARADAALAGGVSHDVWRRSPLAPAWTSAAGPYKRDRTGREVVDLWMGHGALLLGHCHPEVVAALQAAVPRLSHVSGLSETQVAWAERIVALVPGAERVRFTASGSEGTWLALRVARAVTGRAKIVRLDGNYHGWHDEALACVDDRLARTLDPVTSENVLLLSPWDLEGIGRVLASREVAGLILEPGGGSASTLDMDAASLRELRRLCSASGTLLIFDEVISGFRFAPGGVQELSGVRPDLTVLAKIVAGGLPGGVLAGSAAAMRVFGTADLSVASEVVHAGTFNGHPLSAVAGSVTLDLIHDGGPQAQAAEAAAQLCAAVNALAERHGVDLRLFARSSLVHLLIGSVAHRRAAEPGAEAFVLQRRNQAAHAVLQRLLLLEGVDTHPTHAWISAAHDAAALERCLAAFARVFDLLPTLDDWRIA